MKLSAIGVDELLRYDNTIQLGWRTTPADREVGGVAIPGGASVVAWVGSANRDPDYWGPTVDQLDLRRKDSCDHLSFGSGAHLCLGASLARAEIRAVVGALAQRFPKLSLVTEQPQWAENTSIRGVTELVIHLR